MFHPTIDEDRLISDLEPLSEWGRLGNGGVERVAFSDADRRAREWIRSELADPLELSSETT